MKLFVDKNAEIIVNLYVYENENGKLISWTKNNLENKPENILEFQSFTICFRLPNYKDTVELVDSGIQFAFDGSMKISSGASSFGRFAKLLKSWDFKNEKGEDIPAIAENVALLDPAIAKSIVVDLEDQLS